ncbi:hypothetical protein SO802_013670 [Lithocarpus litseifolius]|uniref:Zinc knuckle CX2CX4HX4C domain-containing protein n=1 Tax=Lithocarpus litseifolius TaxID=425828 RepID=A0AAW2D7P7_9ROSI
MGNHVVLFVFSDKSDADRVLLGEPWSYDKYLVSLRRVEKNGAVKDMVFDRTNFWVQIHDIPMCDMTPETTAEIIKGCGEVQPGIREWGNQDGSTFMSIRVRVDTSKSLCHGQKLRNEDGESGCIRFKYERLPIICYWCGRLTHSDKDCELWISSNGSLTENDRQFSAWLRALLFNTRKCSTIRVGGVEEDKLGGNVQEVDGEEDEVLGSRSVDRSDAEHDGDRRQKEGDIVQESTRKETCVIIGAKINELSDSSKVTDF